MARSKNTVADVEARLITKKNTVLIMQEDVQVVLSKTGLAEQKGIFLNLCILTFPLILSDQCRDEFCKWKANATMMMNIIQRKKKNMMVLHSRF